MFQALSNVAGDLKTNVMKSRIKIDYERGAHNHPVIKIITPLKQKPMRLLESPLSNEDVEEDVQDRLISDLLHSPDQVDPNSFFSIKSKFPLDDGLLLTTIGAIQEVDILYQFRHAILNRYIPYNDIVALNKACDFQFPVVSASGIDKCKSTNYYFNTFKKIHEFFDYLDMTQQAAHIERRPYGGSLKQVALKDVGEGNRFIFGGTVFLVDRVENEDPELIFCQIEGHESYAYIAEHTMVEVY